MLILGGGAAGCVLAARLSEDERTSVGLVEAGPDYGPFDVRRWPAAESYFAPDRDQGTLAADEFWDVHIVPSAGPAEDAQDFYTGPLSAGLYVFVMAPRSRDTVRAPRWIPRSPQ